MDPNTELFLETFNRLETAFKKNLKKDKFTPFSQLLREASGKDSYIRLHRSLLDSFSDLRNVLVHKEGNEIIAVPSDEAVKRLLAIVDKYTEPKTVFDVCQKKVVITTPDKSLHHALKIMRHHDSTKIPVYDGKQYKGLLSGNVITRWFTAHVDEDGTVKEDLHRISIEDVIREGNRTNQVQFVPRDMAVYEFVSRTERKPSKSGVYIITEHGKTNEKAIGILTAFDYKRILENILV